ncbi:conserved exported hypothetical protein [Desulfamplus magnetovallimortis]|uniref:Lipoprotein n=1 Tax=Desulfamplus magnetovallimortis TaxID=1246637 RepID=A0A1W1H9R7_9BACT|nr:hypothetical protein [Desulfamplus magnetovallimortis]SLM29193.1 conserved exported hypothetical protein [Desulfamplus magnetovallimortis]
MKKKSVPTKTPLIVLIIFSSVMVISSCSTRGVNDEYFGATEQRLMTHSLDQLVSMLPEEDFMPFNEQNVYVECHFIEDEPPLKYALKRIELELTHKYSCTIVDSPDAADIICDFFFTAFATDQDSFGFKTPEFMIPGSSGTVSIDLIALDMYHGVSELYYYITDPRSNKVTRGERIKSIIRTDKLSLPIISIPVSTLK